VWGIWNNRIFAIIKSKRRTTIQKVCNPETDGTPETMGGSKANWSFVLRNLKNLLEKKDNLKS
jgi:hypothetical protein